MWKKLTSFALGVTMLFTGSVFASEIQFTATADNEQGVINISGTAPADWGSRKIAIMVGRPGASDVLPDYDNLDEAAFLSSVYTVTEAECDGDGAFSKQISLPSNAVLGYYLIRVGATGLENDASTNQKVLFATKADALALLNQINSAANGSGIKAVINGTTGVNNLPNAEILSLNVADPMYVSYADKLCEYLFALKNGSYQTLLDLQTAFHKSSLLTKITYAVPADMVTEIEASASVLGIDITSAEYTRNKPAVVTLVKSNIAKLPEYQNTPEKFFAAMSAIAAINAANRETVMGILESNAANLDITLGTEYTALSSYEVGKALVGKNFADVAGVQTALQARIAELTNQNVGGGVVILPSVGGGGGGGGGAISNPTPIQPIQPYQEIAATNAKFNDVTTSHWAYEAVNALSEKEIINGMGDGKFVPSGSVTREQITKMIVLAFQLKGTQTSQFSDVAQDAWYTAYINAASATGIVNGMGDGAFGVGREVSRQDLMVMLYRAMQNAGQKFSSAGVDAFSDRDSISEYAKEAVGALYGLGIVNGSNGKIEPLRVCTRAEAAKLIFETMKTIETRTEAGIYEN